MITSCNAPFHGDGLASGSRYWQTVNCISIHSKTITWTSQNWVGCIHPSWWCDYSIYEELIIGRHEQESRLELKLYAHTVVESIIRLDCTGKLLFIYSLASSALRLPTAYIGFAQRTKLQMRGRCKGHWAKCAAAAETLVCTL